MRLSWLSFFLLFYINTSIIGQSAQLSLCPEDPWQIIFEDNFDGPVLDTNKWRTYYAENGTDQCGSCRRSDTVLSNQIYKDENVVFKDSILRLVIKKEASEWHGQKADYSAGVITSKNLYYNELKYEIRCKVAKNLGSLSSFWIFGWYTEIDFFEMGRDKRMPFMTLHRWNGNKSVFDQFRGYKGPDLSEDYHVFAVIYDPVKMQYLLDGKVIHTKYKYLRPDKKKGKGVDVCLNPEEGLIESPYWPLRNMPCNLITASAVGNIKKNKLFQMPGKNAVWPDTFHVDYIRVYKRSCIGFPEQETIVSKNEHWFWNRDLKDIYVEDDVTLTVTDCRISFMQGSKIVLGKNSKLIIANADFKSCNPDYRWEGIIGAEGSEVQILHNSKLRDANLVLSDPDFELTQKKETTKLHIDASSRYYNCLRIRE